MCQKRSVQLPQTAVQLQVCCLNHARLTSQRAHLFSQRDRVLHVHLGQQRLKNVAAQQYAEDLAVRIGAVE